MLTKTNPTRTPLKTERLRVQVDEEMLVWLRAESLRRRVSLSQVVRDLIWERMCASR